MLEGYSLNFGGIFISFWGDIHLANSTSPDRALKDYICVYFSITKHCIQSIDKIVSHLRKTP